MEITAKVQAIGKDALSPKDAMVILFGEKATPELRDVCVIQEFTDPAAQKKMHVRPGDHIYINDIKYRVAGVGGLTDANLEQIAHATLIFKAVPDDDDVMGNAIYLTPFAKPIFEVGTTIRYDLAD
ncbi:PTS glucitol/sorbitol transporter subunit IIA [Lacticaseibacillus zhaodongensis]|uniref:PTS glucitol/sorbitol transporter subunit IIA n=1 Tax=Lacticaseibacillus zhaodongensis TaxID=2668065 RepID=UPI0012D33686|nr:PTS glucitol/sorbitol transporter subunit IIA [Lacticaseibacillus zhaodongensis]